MSFLGDLMVNLGIDTTQFTSGITGAQSSIQSFSNNIARSFGVVNDGSAAASRNIDLFAGAADSAFKSVSRIAQGIIVSQMFYGVVRSVEGAGSAIAEMSSQLEQAHVSFSILMKDSAKADQFLQVIENFAARTPFTVQQSVDNARKLMAYGFKSENIMPIMGTIADASAAAGTPEAFDNISRALGEINAKGSLTARQLLSITSAGIPAYEILQQKLGLTAKQLQNIGNAHVPASIAINAILSGMKERYGGAADAMSETVDGMINTVKDNAKLIGTGLFAPLYANFKETLSHIRDESDSLLNIFRKGGVGAVLQNIIPPDVYPALVLFADNVKHLAGNIVLAFQTIWPFVTAIGMFLVNAFNMIAPPLNLVAHIILTFTSWVANSTPFVKQLVGAIGGLLIAGQIASYLFTLGSALKGLFIVKAVAQMVLNLSAAIQTLTIVMIENPILAAVALVAGILLYLAMTSQYAQRALASLGATMNSAFGGNSLDVSPSMNANTVSTTNFNKALDGADDNMTKFGDSAAAAGKKAKNAVASFDEVFELQKAAADAGAGTGLDNQINPVIPEVKVPAIKLPSMSSTQGWLTAWWDGVKSWWSKLCDGTYFRNAWHAFVKGLTLDWLGLQIEWSWWSIQFDNFFNYTKKGIADWWKNTTTGFGNWWRDTKTGFTNWTTFTGILFSDWWDTTKRGLSGWWNNTALGFSNWWKDTKIGFTDWWTTTSTGFSNWVADTTKGIGNWWTNTSTGFNNWFTDTKLGFDLWWKSTALGLSGWWINTSTGFSNWWEKTKTGFTGWVNDTTKSFTSWFTTKDGFSLWVNETKLGLSTWWTDTSLGLSKWWKETKLGFTNWWKDNTTGFSNWSTETISKVTGWWTDTKLGFTSWWNDTSTGFSTWWTNTTTGFSNWTTNTVKSINDWITKSKEALNAWLSDTKSYFDTWWNATTTGFSNWIKTTKDGLIQWAKDTYEGVIGWWSKLMSQLQTFWDKIKENATTNTGLVGGASQVPAVQNAGAAISKLLGGHASGGVFNKEHIANFAEGNRAEAIIPLENEAGMAPFVNAVSGGVSAQLTAALIAAQGKNTNGTSNGSSSEDNRTILYVGTLIADDRSLKELDRKMRIITLQENQRRGIT